MITLADWMVEKRRGFRLSEYPNARDMREMKCDRKLRHAMASLRTGQMDRIIKGCRRLPCTERLALGSRL